MAEGLLQMLQQLTIQSAGELAVSVGKARPLQEPEESTGHIWATVCQTQPAKTKRQNIKCNPSHNHRSFHWALTFLCKRNPWYLQIITWIHRWCHRCRKMKTPYLEFRWDTPSSTQLRLVFWSPTSTTQALLSPLPNVAHTDSWCTMIAVHTHKTTEGKVIVRETRWIVL